ncbi:MAG: hypothetical protein CEE38_21155 [Planctomycetes bacterium B3_Pla]|nr:MAG: hypothetical protein CEE38_21155 [Planctomycetes bacterium B3_Pla]
MFKKNLKENAKKARNSVKEGKKADFVAHFLCRLDSRFHGNDSSAGEWRMGAKKALSEDRA